MRDRVEELIGFQPGGVCPFGVPLDIPIWLDVSMKRFEYVHPAGGNEFTSVSLTPDELEKHQMQSDGVMFVKDGKVQNKCKEQGA